MLSAQRAVRLRSLLDPFLAGFDAAGRVAFDPVEAPRAYAAAADQEIAGLIAAGLSYGRADLFKPKIFGLLREMGPSPAAFVRSFDPARDGSRFASFGYRFNLPADIGALLAGAGHILRGHESLGSFLGGEVERRGLRDALALFAQTIRREGAALVGDTMGPIRALEHLLADASRGGACKRLLLYLRWMVRRDAVDLGTWEALIPRASLLIPVDTHVLRVSRLLGLTTRSDASWRTAEEITASLRRLDPGDPVKYDFALCHLGMSGACPARRERANCLRCPLQSGCTAGRRFAQVAAAGDGSRG